MRSIFPKWAAVLLQAAGFLSISIVGVLEPTTANAHASLVRSFPASNEILTAPAAIVRLEFNEPVRVIRAVARDADGGSQDLPADSAGATTTLHLKEPVKHGTVIISYRVESEDGHPVGGSLVFSVGSPSPFAGVQVQNATSALSIAIWAVQTVGVLYLAAVVGGALFNRWLDPTHISTPRTGATIGLGFVLLLTGLYLQGLDELGANLIYDGFEPLKAAARSNAAIAGALEFLAIVLAAAPIWPTRWARLGAAILAIIAASAAFTFIGHCNVVESRWLARACIFLHGAILLFWIGSLAPLWRVSQSEADQRSLLGFSRAIPLPFAVMLAAGAVLAFIELPDISHLLSSHYGQILVVKIGLVSGLCLLASYNRFWLTTPAAEGDRSARFRLRRSIACEVVVAAAIVGAASLWRFASPIPPAIKQPSLSVHLHSANVMAQFELSQGSADKATARVFVMRPDFGPFEPRSVDLRLLNPEAGVEPIKYPLQKSPDGGWEAAVLPIANPKGWKVDVAVLIDDFVSAHLEGNLMPQ